MNIKQSIMFTIALAFALTLTMFAAVPATSAIDVGEGSSDTTSTISVYPNPALVWKPVYIQVQVNPLPPQAPINDPTHYWHSLTLKITKPNGNMETIEGLVSDDAGKLNYTYYPAFVGNYTFELYFPTQTLTFQNLGVPMHITYSITYQQSNSTTFLTVMLTAPSPSPSIPPAANSSVPEFTLNYVDNSYDVPPTTASSTDPYTGKTTTTTAPGYHVENKTIQATIENNIGASYYNFRYKGHYTTEWSYYPFSPSSSGYSLGDTFSVPYQASNSSYTLAALPSYFFQSVPPGGQVDVQVQALFGNFRAVPYGHIVWVGGPTYDFYFEGTTSEWSNIQTITIPDTSTPSSTSSPAPSTTPNPSIPEFPTWIALAPMITTALAFVLLRKKFSASPKLV